MSSFPVFALSANESAKSLASLANSPQRDLPLSEDFLAFVKDFRFQPKTTLQTPLPSIASILNRKHEAYYQDLIIPSEPSFSLFQKEFDHHSAQTTHNNNVPLKTLSQSTQHQPTQSQPTNTNNAPTQTTFTVRKSAEKKKTDSNVITIKISANTSATPTPTPNSTSTPNSTPTTPTSSPTQTDQTSPSTPKLTATTSTPTSPTTPIAPTSPTSPASPANTNTNEKKRKRWDDDDMVRAMGLVREKKMSVRGAATHCNVPRSTLWDRLSGRVVHGVDSRKKPRRYDSQRLLKAI
jgi:hypothetical protein